MNTLNQLGKLSMTRVLATGRNVHSLLNVIEPDFPIDYLVFSNGAGIMHWPSKEIVYKRSLHAEQVTRLISGFSDFNLDFMIQRPIPENHRFGFVRSSDSNPDFDHRLKLYADYCFPWAIGHDKKFGPASQLLAITPPGEHYIEQLHSICGEFSLLRTTSPLNHRSMWLEVFQKGVSKSTAVERVCALCGCSSSEVLAVGNDYNDMDLLRWAGFPAVVANAPLSMQEEFPVVSSHDEDGFTRAVEKTMSRLSTKSLLG
jgi:hydroxymethylpyrimidine pyrophosphatase-like HAD family hydrolase